MNDFNITNSAAEAGRCFRSLLKERKLTYEAFAEMVSVDTRTVSRWVKSLNSLENIDIICRVLKVSRKEILRW